LALFYELPLGNIARGNELKWKADNKLGFFEGILKYGESSDVQLLHSVLSINNFRAAILCYNGTGQER
jgi:hypothetical protein